jgi:hypothetical protein
VKKVEAIEHAMGPIARSDAEALTTEEARRKQISADFELVFMRHPRGPAVLAEIARILHFVDAARTPEDMALQNAFKTILHRLGRWADDEKGSEELVTRLLGR